MPGPFDPPGLSMMDPSVVANTGGGLSPFGSPFLNDPEYRRHMAFETLTNAGLGLLKASSPSPYPTDFGTMFGGLAGGAAMGAQGAEDKYLKRALTGTQVAMAQQKIKQLQDWQKLFSGAQGGAPGQVATDSGTFAPPSAGAPGPAMPSGGGVTAPPANNVGNVTAANGGFLNPATPEAGTGDLVGWLKAAPVRYTNGQPITLNQIAVKYAPADDGKDPMLKGNDPAVWAKNVGQIAGIDPNQPLDFDNPAVVTAVSRAINQQEKAPTQRQPGGVIQNGVAQAMDPTAFPPAAGPPVQLAQGGAAPPNATGQGDAPRPQAAPAPAPPSGQTLAQVVRNMPPGVRQLIGVMGPEAGIAHLLKYADPDKVPVFNSQTKEFQFVDKTEIGKNPQLVPPDAAQFSIALQKEAREGMNAKVIPGANGQPVPNAPLLEFDKGVSAAQGTDAAGHALKGKIDDARKVNTELQTGALHARTGLAQVNRLGGLLDQVNTGRFTSSTQEIKAMAKGLGIDLHALGVADNVAPSQAADALTKQLALTLRDPSQGGGMPGALSNADRDFLARMVPGLETDPNGRKLMIEYAKKMYTRQIELAKIANDYARSKDFDGDPLKLHTLLQQYADANPLFEQQNLPPNGMSPMPTPPAGYSLPGQGGPKVAPPPGFRIVK